MFADAMMLDSLLRVWKADPMRPRKKYRGNPAWDNGSPEGELPLSEGEVDRMKAELKRMAPTQYAELFPDSSDG